MTEIPIRRAYNPENYQGVIITDCADTNARSRQNARFQSLFGFMPSFVELEDGLAPDLEAAGQLIDALDAARTPNGFDSKPLVALVNVAPRGDSDKKRGEGWENGTPFCHTSTENGDRIFSTFNGRALSLARNLGAIGSQVELLDVPTVTDQWVREKLMTSDEAQNINNTQFRSLEFLPLAAKYALDGASLPHIKAVLEDEDIERLVWKVDNFGNVKTTSTKNGLAVTNENHELMVDGQHLPMVDRLTDVPDGTAAVITGSSGYDDERFLEVVIKGGDAAFEFNLHVGSKVFDQYRSLRAVKA